MNSLPSLKRRQIIKALKRLGFVPGKQVGSHLTMKHPDGRRASVWVHDGKELRPESLKETLILAGIAIEDFLNAHRGR